MKKLNVMKTIDLKTLSKYDNQYIAISKDKAKILAAGKTIKQLDKKLEKMKIEGVIIHYVPPMDVALSLICWL